jgi:hypothetical protein
VINLLILLATAGSTIAVPLETIHTDPSVYEDQIVETCGDVYPNQAIIFMREWISGRSRGGMKLKKRFLGQGYVCVQARVIRAPVVEKDSSLLEIIVSHPPVVPAGWQLEIILPPSDA